MANLNIFKNRAKHKIPNMKLINLISIIMIFMSLNKAYGDGGLNVGVGDATEENEVNVAHIKEVFATVLNDPEYLSLEPIKKLKILIVFYHILENPNQNWYANLIEMLNEKINENK